TRRVSDRPPPAHTGGSGEPTCHVCHFEYEENDGRATIERVGLPPLYVPGEKYTLTVTLAHPELRVGGFQLSARFADGGRVGMQAGALRALDERVDVTPPSELPVQYARHTGAGVVPPEPDAARIAWRVVWTSPPEGGAVAFHVATNVANDDASPLGDRVYTRSFEGRVRK
ncbi:MAG TPA: choice-of-anchor V domain-containing protein, partial [Gemmatimonadaceae bacterium]|nr:choice-of-anchor V domain-containing protein [Gemmatimonadaceae bacterium]